MRSAVRVILAAVAACVLPAGCPGGDGGTDAGVAPADGGAAVTILRFDALPVPMQAAVALDWESAGAARCTIEDAGGAIALTELPATGERQIAADFEAAGYQLALTLRCEGARGATSATYLGPVPHITRFDATPSTVRAGDETVLCWALEGGVTPVCAIFAMETSEYYYPLEAADCLFPLVLEATSSFLLYCSPDNGYVEQELTVAVDP
jgi:hypothetical protein